MSKINYGKNRNKFDQKQEEISSKPKCTTISENRRLQLPKLQFLHGRRHIINTRFYRASSRFEWILLVYMFNN